MENNTFPTLNNCSESQEIIITLLPMFCNYLKEDPKVISLLLPLQKNGNSKAAELIKYLIGVKPKFIHYKRIYQPSNHLEEYRTEYSLSWSDFRIDKSNNKKITVQFDFEAILEKEVKLHGLKSRIISARQPSAFRSEFLMKELAQWLKENGYKLHRANPVENKGALSPYVEIKTQPVSERPNPEYPENDWCNLTNHVTGRCIIQILPL